MPDLSSLPHAFGSPDPARAPVHGPALGADRGIPRRHRISTAAAIATSGLALVALRRLLHEASWRQLRVALHQVPTLIVIAAAAAALLSYATLALYDVTALRYAGSRHHTGRIALGGAIAFALSNTLGFPLLSGGAIRIRLWTSWEFSAEQIARAMAFNTITFWIGAVAVGAAGALATADEIARIVGASPWLFRAGGLIGLATVGAYLLATQRWSSGLRLGDWEFPMPSPWLGLAQLGLGTLDWTAAALTMWVLLPAGIRPGLPAFAGLFVLAQLVGVISHVPGGAGVFEAGMLLLLGARLGGTTLLAALLMFRLVYYIAPFTLALIGLGAWEGAARWPRFAEWSAPTRRVLRGLAPTLVAAGVFAAGVVLLVSAATPADPRRLRGLRLLIPLFLIESSHLISSTVGASLLLLAAALRKRLDAAWWLTCLLLVAGAVSSLLKGFDWEEASLLTLMLLLLLPARRFFYRRSRMLAAALTPGWYVGVIATVTAVGLLMAFAYRRVPYSNELWWRFTVRGDAPRSMRAMLGATVVVALFGVRRLLGTAPPAPARRATSDQLARVARILAEAGTTHGFLAYTGDKHLLFDAEGRGFLMYAVSGRTLVVMGDPIGPPPAQRELAWNLRELADREGLIPAFYQVRPDSLALYIDLGLSLVKLGEEAQIDAASFDLTGSHRANLRHSHRRVAEREGCRWELLGPSEVPGWAAQLRAVSDTWLADRMAREKRFSLGRFDEHYLIHTPVAVVFQGSRLIAFANLWPSGTRDELSVDLMRYASDAPNGTMDYLFVELIQHARAEGYRTFNLGMAPLAGLPDHALASLWSRVGQLIYMRGEGFYGFQGLRAYKAKFLPRWTARYLASPGGLALPRVIADIAALIAGGPRRN